MLLRASFTGDYTTAVLGIAYVTAFTLVVLYIAARIFTTEKILTMRLRLRRRKLKGEEIKRTLRASKTFIQQRTQC